MPLQAVIKWQAISVPNSLNMFFLQNLLATKVTISELVSFF